VERKDVGVRKGGDSARLPFEAGERIGIGGELLGQDLYRDLAAEPRVPRPLDLSHPARAER